MSREDSRRLTHTNFVFDIFPPWSQNESWSCCLAFHVWECLETHVWETKPELPRIPALPLAGNSLGIWASLNSLPRKQTR